MPMVQQQKLTDGYATIRRTKGRVEKKFRLLSSENVDRNQFEMNDICMSRKSMNRECDFEIIYKKRNVVFDESSEVDDGVLNNDIESDADAQSSDSNSKRQTFETFKPRNSIESGDDDGSDKDLQHSSECFQSLPYDIIMSPLKSPHYINQLNAMRSKAPNDCSKQFALYSRPDSPKYGRLHRSTSPSADSLADNSSSNSSTYSSNHQHQSAVFKHTAMSQSLHLPHPQNEENLILININPAHSPHKVNESHLNYRKSFSHIQSNSNHTRWHDDAADDGDSLEGNNKILLDSMTMTKSLYNPSISTSQLSSHQRFATLAYHPKEKQQQQLQKLLETSNKSSSSLNERHFAYLDPIMSCKVGSQTILRTNLTPWYELAINRSASNHRQSCPPLQVNLINYFYFYNQ